MESDKKYVPIGHSGIRWLTVFRRKTWIALCVESCRDFLIVRRMKIEQKKAPSN